MQFSIREESGIYYLTFNPNAYNYVYRNCYVRVIERSSDLLEFTGNYHKILNRIGVSDTNISEYRIYVSEQPSKSYLEPLPENIAEYLSKLNLKIHHITSLRTALIVTVFRDSSIKLPKDLIKELEKLPPGAELRRKIVVEILPITEEQSKMIFNITDRIAREATNGSLKSLCLQASGLSALQMPEVYINRKCMEKRNLSERQIIDAIRRIVDESYPLQVIVGPPIFWIDLPLPVNRSTPEAGTLSTTVTYILLVSFATCTLLTSFLVAIIMFRKRKIRRT